MKRLIGLLFITQAWAGSVYIDQVGSGNNISVDSNNSQSIILSQGNNNTLTINQLDTGSHVAFMGTPPSGMNGNSYVVAPNQGNNNNILGILQSGSGNHIAAINLDPLTVNNNNTASINQSGAADKSFVLGLKGSGISANIVQDSPTVSDKATMNITCLAPPCTGYSYVKH
jgi:hypothetical protein